MAKQNTLGAVLGHIIVVACGLTLVLQKVSRLESILHSSSRVVHSALVVRALVLCVQA
jgi:hypothetical protein